MSSKATPITERRLSPVQVLLFLILVGLVGAVSLNFFLLNQRNAQETQYLALTTEIQVRAQQLAKAAGEAAVGNFDAFDEMENTRDIIADAIDQLRNGNPETDLPPSPAAVNDSLSTLEQIWQGIDEEAERILSRAELVLDLADAAAAFATNIPRLQALSDEAVRLMIQTGTPTSQIYLGSRQLVLADRMLRRVGEILGGGGAAITAADAFSREAELFDQVLQGLLLGNDELNIPAVRNEQVLAALAEIQPVYEEVKIDVDTILAGSSDLFEVREAADEIFLDSQELTAQADALAEVTTLEGYTEWMKGLLTPIPDGRYELTAFAADAERGTVVATAVFHGTQSGPGGPVAPTGKTVASDYAYVMTFEGDRIRHMTKIWNDVPALRQLGWA